MNLPYLIWSYDYSHASAGPKALHRLCHELNEAGEAAAVAWPVRNQEWNTPYCPAQLQGEYIAVYPEIVSGNPWNAPHVARWVLNVPGLLGGDKVYDPAEMVFTWDRRFLDGVPLLQLPTIETEIYQDQGLPRSGTLSWVGKGQRSARIDGASEITLAMRLDRHALADALNRAEALYSFDEISGMNWIALLCGCPVLVIPSGQRLEPAGFRDEYQAIIDAAPAQLAAFIAITQAPRSVHDCPNCGRPTRRAICHACLSGVTA